MSNARHLRGSAWLNFNRLVCDAWSHFNGRSHVVLMGDAAHTAHLPSARNQVADDAIELANNSTRLGMNLNTSPDASGQRGYTP